MVIHDSNINKITEINKILSIYKNNPVLISSYKSSLRRLLLVIEKRDTQEHIFIVAGGVNFFKGHFRFINKELKLIRNINNEKYLELVDRKMAFILKASDMIFFIGKKDDFIKQAPDFKNEIY